MAGIPRIARVVPHGSITRPQTALPVVARLRWASGQDIDVLAIAVAWTREAVEIRWQHQGEYRTDWIAATDVRRSLQAPVRDSSPPTSRGMKRTRW